MTGYLGLDLGTSGLKLALWAEDGTLRAEGEAAYAVERPRPGWAQIDTRAWVAALTRGVESLAPALRQTSVLAVGVAGQMHGAVLTDAAGAPLGAALLWPDRRAEAEVALWRALPAATRARLANPLVPGMTGPLLAWLARHDPGALGRADLVLLPKDVLRGVLAGPAATDRSDASATLLWDVVADDWSSDAAAAAGIPAGLLPPVLRSDAVVGATDWLADAVAGATAQVPVVAGAADTPAAALAIGAAGDLQINLGSGGQVLRALPAAAAVPDAKTHLYADAGDGWYAMAAVQNAGLALEWVCSVLDLSWRELMRAADAPAGARGVSFLPFLTGERGGVAGPTSAGSWTGLHAATTRNDLARAAVEGVAFALRRAADLLSGPPETDAAAVRLTGGGGREPLIQQLLADALARPVQRVEVRSASAAGAAVLAARGVGAVLEPRRVVGPLLEPGRQSRTMEAYERWLHALDRAR